MTVGVRHSEMGALLGFAERQLYVYKRYWVWEVVWLFYSIVSVLSIGFLASGLSAVGGASPGFDLHRAQLYLLIGALLLTAGVVFGGLLPFWGPQYPNAFLCIPVLLWSAFRFGPRETATVVFFCR